MCNNDDISPYLRRPLRTYEQFLRDVAMRAARVDGNADSGAAGESSQRMDDQGTASQTLTRVQWREEGARH